LWRKWAGNLPPTNNAPLRDGKGTLYEGGTRVPLMWSWAGRIAPGTTSEAVVGHVDLYPTLLELLGLPRPPQQVMDGQSYAGVLTGKSRFERAAFFNYFPQGRDGGGVGVRAGDWKTPTRACRASSTTCAWISERRTTSRRPSQGG